MSGVYHGVRQGRHGEGSQRDVLREPLRPVGATIADGQGLGTIVNDDGKPKTLEPSPPPVLAEAAASTVTQSDSVAGRRLRPTDQQPTAIADASQPVRCRCADCRQRQATAAAPSEDK